MNQRIHTMIDKQLKSRGIKDPQVLEAMSIVPRELFVPTHLQDAAYEDTPLPIGHKQTISQPYIVALMLELAKLNKEDRVLEIGTGSGYQTAILAELVHEIYTIEIVKELATETKKLFNKTKYKNIHMRIGDGYEGWPEYAPFDAVIVTAAPIKVPEVLLNQLKIGGRLIIPVGSHYQSLMRLTRNQKGFSQESFGSVQFVPMINKIT